MSNNPPLRPGEYMTGKDADGNLTNWDDLGREYCVPLRDFLNTGGSRVKGRLTSATVKVRVVRNTSGGTLTGGDVVQMDVTTAPALSGTNPLTTGSNELPLLENAAKKADGSGLDHCCIVDPAITGTIPDDGIFLAVVKGPSFVNLPATAPALSIGDRVQSAATGTIEALAADKFGIGYMLQATATPANDSGQALLYVLGNDQN